MTKRLEPGRLGRVSKGTSFEISLLNEYASLVDDGVLDLSWSNFVNQALEHELARYKRERRSRK